MQALFMDESGGYVHNRHHRLLQAATMPPIRTPSSSSRLSEVGKGSGCSGALRHNFYREQKETTICHRKPLLTEVNRQEKEERCQRLPVAQTQALSPAGLKMCVGRKRVNPQEPMPKGDRYRLPLSFVVTAPSSVLPLVDFLQASLCCSFPARPWQPQCRLSVLFPKVA